MPIYVGYSQKRRTVRLIDAGKDSIYLCGVSVITLKANVTDITNLRNHVFEFEQIYGPAATLTRVDELTATFPLVDSSDKIFRFWVDKGTPKEQFADVNIFFTPTSVHEKMAYSSRKVPAKMGTWNHVAPNRAFSDLLYFDETDTNFNTDIKAIPITEMTFDAVSSAYAMQAPVLRYEVLDANPNNYTPQTVLQSFDGPNPPAVILFTPGRYQLRIVYDTGPVPKTASSPFFTIAQNEIDGYKAVNTNYNLSGVFTVAKTPTVRLAIVNKVETEDYNLTTIHHYAKQQLVRYTPVILNYLNKPELLIDEEPFGIFTVSVSPIARSNPTNIGST